MPYTDADSAFSITRRGIWLVCTTSYDLIVEFTGNAFTSVKVPQVYIGSLEGACGNFDDDPENDLVTIDGNPGSSCEVGVSWTVPDPNDPE